MPVEDPDHRLDRNAQQGQDLVGENSSNSQEEEEDGEGEQGEGDDSEEDDFGEEQVSWIEWFCGLKGNEFFVEVDDDYAQDDFNLTDLSSVLYHYYDCDVYRESLNMILDYDDLGEMNDREGRKDPNGSGGIIDQASQCLYGLIHARFILTTRGMSAMFEKYNSYFYGTCPLMDCHSQHQAVLPIGMYDAVGKGGTRVFCPRCKELYLPKSAKLTSIDGAFFGTSFPHLFFLTYPQWKPSSEPRPYIPRIFGFKVNNRAKAKQWREQQQALAIQQQAAAVALNGEKGVSKPFTDSEQEAQRTTGAPPK